MSAAHTPGPWKAKRHERATNFGNGRVDVEDAKRRTVARAIYGAQSIAIQEGEAEANARLIAAAPQLAEALCRALDSLECNGNIGCETEREMRAALTAAGVTP